MGRYPRTVRDAAIKCIECNAPVATTVDDRYVCVECGRSLISPNDAAAAVGRRSE